MDAASWNKKLAKWDSKGGTVMPLELVLLGIVGETAELIEAVDNDDNEEVCKEAGDVLWYIRAACKRRNLSFPSVYAYACETDDGNGRYWDPTTEGTLLLKMVGKLCDDMKKNLWHGKTLTKVEFIELLAPILRRVTALADEFGGWDDDQIFSANIEKLQKRYPNGFVEGGGIR